MKKLFLLVGLVVFLAPMVVSADNNNDLENARGFNLLSYTYDYIDYKYGTIGLIILFIIVITIVYLLIRYIIFPLLVFIIRLIGEILSAILGLGALLVILYVLVQVFSNQNTQKILLGTGEIIGNTTKYISTKWDERKLRKQQKKMIKSFYSKNSNKSSYQAQEGSLDIIVDTTYGSKILHCPEGRSFLCIDDSGRNYEFIDENTLMDISSGQEYFVDD